MFGDKLNLGSLLKNAKKMQEMVEQTQTELQNTEVTGDAGAGAVKITMNARHQVKSLELEDDIIKEDKAVLEDLIIAAFNAASQKVEKITQSKMMDASKMFGGGKTDDE